MNKVQEICFTVFMILVLAYYSNLMTTSWQQTQHNVATSYQKAQEQCQLDQWEFCGSPRYPELLSQETTWVSSTTAWTWVPDSRPEDDRASLQATLEALPESYLRTSRRLAETSNTYVFPSHCLQTADAEKRLRRDCSHALEDWHRALEMQQWLAWMYQMYFGLAFVMWFGFGLYKLFLYYQEKSLKEGDTCCYCCCYKNDACCCCCCENDSFCADTIKQAAIPQRTDSRCYYQTTWKFCNCSCCGCCRATQSAQNSSATKEEEEMPILCIQIL